MPEVKSVEAWAEVDRWGNIDLRTITTDDFVRRHMPVRRDGRVIPVLITPAPAAQTKESV